MQGSYRRLALDVREGASIEYIRNTYNPDIVRKRQQFSQMDVLGELLPRSQWEALSVPDYCVGLLRWLLEECDVLPSVLITVGMSVLDWVCKWQYVLPARPMLDYLLERGATSVQSLDQCLTYCAKGSVLSVKVALRLLDAGAVPRPACAADLFKQTRSWVEHMSYLRCLYGERLDCRAVCIVLMALPRRSALARRCLPRDVLLLIAKPVWAQRFSWFPRVYKKPKHDVLWKQ